MQPTSLSISSLSSWYSFTSVLEGTATCGRRGDGRKEADAPGEESLSQSTLDIFQVVAGMTSVVTQVLWYSQVGPHQVPPEDGLKYEG